jgi:hypothetical protein
MAITGYYPGTRTPAAPADSGVDRSPTDWSEERGRESSQSSYQPTRYKPATGQTETTTQTQQTVFTGERPEYEKPEWDEGEIRKLSRKIQAPGIRQLRQQVQQVFAKHYENPNVRSMMLRNALQGYGIGLEGVISGSETQARGEYAQRYSFDVQEAMAKYQAAWNEYMASGKTTTTRTGTTQQTFGGGAGGYSGPYDPGQLTWGNKWVWDWRTQSYKESF